MLTYRVLLGVASLVFGLVACGGEDASVASGDDEIVKSPPTAKEVEELFHAIDDNCAGNSNGHLRKFDVAKFNASAALKELKEADKSAMGVDCSKERSYSTSRESAVALVLAHINDKNEDTKSCLAEHLTSAQRSRLKQIVSDPGNVGVFAGQYAGGDLAEACDYYDFHIYRRDGTLIELTFNFTD